MEQKISSEPTINSNNFRDEALKFYSPPSFQPQDMKLKKESKFKTINNNS